jgi:putative component of toxin-antitoxin plasmid stabilization module
MYVDHLMSTSPASAEDVWNATREHAKLFGDAATRIGLSPAEYREFRTALLDGKAAYVKLPRRLDAMSGARRGSAYAVHNAVMQQTIMGWRVALADGNTVYVPQVCGNISLLRRSAVASAGHAPLRLAKATHPHYVQAAYHVPAAPPARVDTPVTMVPPEDVPIEAAPTIAQAVPAAAASHGNPFLYFIPVAIGGIVAGVSHPGTPAGPPPCSAGSNSYNACTK